MASEEVIPDFFIRVPSEKLIKPAVEYLTQRMSKYDQEKNGTGVIAGGTLPKPILRTPQEYIDRATLLLGEIKAGNNSLTVKKEAREILDLLLKKGAMSKDKYSNVLKTWGL